MDDRLPLAIGLPLTDAVMLVVTGVDSTLVVRLKPVRRALLSQIYYRLRYDLIIIGAVKEQRRGNRIQMATRKRAKVQGFSFRGESDAIRGYVERCGSLTTLAVGKTFSF